MFAGTVLLSGRDWLWPGLVLLGFALATLVWCYRRASADRWVRTSGLFLKFLGLAALFLCLLEPLWSGQRARPGANFLAIVADNSQGLRTKDRGESRSRGEVLRHALTTDQTSWQGKLEENFQVRRYLFDSRLQYTKSFAELDFNGRSSAIGGALRSLADRYRGQPLAGVLLFTDGNATDLPQALTDFSGLPPIYPVVIGRDDPIKDIAIQKVAVAQTAFEDAPVSVQADVACTGFVGAELVGQLAELLDNPSNPGVPQEKIVAEQTQKTLRDGETLAFRFQVRPEKRGIRFYRLRVGAKNELGAFARPETSSEATLANNTRVVTVDRGSGPYRILYVAGRPNWEYKFFRRAIEEDDQLQLSAIIRIAKREPKMEFRGHAGESSNPLFRGFGNQSKEETEQYDQPVLRPIAPDEDEFNRLKAGFPKTAEELFRYEAVMVDDLEAQFFTREQMSLLQKFVSERGGGFLMLGGQESFQNGDYDRTPIGEMLPVYLNHRAPPKAPESGYRLNLTREGWLQPWVRLRNNEADEKKRLEEAPPFHVLNPLPDPKPGASVLATVLDGSGKAQPALVVQRYGHGRTAALAIGDLWHWGFRDKEARRDMDKAWRQLIRWLIADVPQRIQTTVETKPSDPDQAVLLQVRVRDEKFQPLDNASVTLLVRSVGVQAETSAPAGPDPAVPARNPALAEARLTAEPAPSEPGLYQATYIPRLTGGYLAEAVVTNALGAEVGRAQAGWSSDPAADEFRSLKPNRALLDDLARKTGGEVIAMERLDAFANSLPQRKVPIVENWSLPLWHQPLVFLFALTCFVGEWGLRRWKGLA